MPMEHRGHKAHSQSRRSPPRAEPSWHSELKNFTGVDAPDWPPDSPAPPETTSLAPDETAELIKAEALRFTVVATRRSWRRREDAVRHPLASARVSSGRP